jgi:hypothetical protein
MSISGNLVGSYSSLGKTFILVDEEGNEITGVCVDNPVVFTAGDNDVREGMVYAGDDGVSTGTKNIPAYHTLEGYRIITAGSELRIPNMDSKINYYDYTKLQTIVCSFNTNLSDSVSAEKVSIGDNVYDVQSTESLSTIIKNHDNQSIDFGITNELNKPCIIRFFTYKETE